MRPRLRDVVSEPAGRACPVCGAAGPVTPFLDGSVDPGKLDRFAYASRKLPEFMSLRLVACNGCATVYAPEPPPPSSIARAYADAAFDSAAEAECAARSYARALAPFLARAGRGAALEVGAGTGAFLSHLVAAGFAPVTGVEPSSEAVAAAPAAMRSLLRVGMFEEAAFAPASLRLFACFQTLEHVLAPSELVAAAFRLLEPGGMIALVTHDRTALINRLLGRWSPIIDLEHLQLFCPAALDRLLVGAGFSQVAIVPITNAYPLGYWVRLLPLPRMLKRAMLGGLARLGLGRMKLALPVGNILSVAFKPA